MACGPFGLGVTSQLENKAMRHDIETLARQGEAVNRAGHKPLSQDRWASAGFYAHQFAMAIMALEAAGE